jgi:hypothetical protein
LTGYEYIFSIQGLVNLILAVYIIAMFRNVYKQGYFKTICKAAILSFAYTLALAFFLIFEVVVSFWLY